MSARYQNPPNPTGTGDGPVREQLDRLLASPQFKTSRRCSDFLRHVVQATAEGRADTLKERNLGTAIFDRPPDYDTNQDPIVRNTAGQVRKRLAQYYVSPGHESEVRIDLPPGSYVPEITAPAHAPVPEAAVVPRANTRRWVVAGVGCAAVVLIVLWATRPVARSSGLDAFWAPVLRAAGPVTVCVGQGHTYKLNEEWDRYFEGQAGERGSQPLPAEAVPLGTILPVWDRHIGLSDAQAAVRVASLFARFGREVALRGGRTTSLADLRRKPVVLIGAFNNEWTLRLAGEVRFYFDTENGEFFVRDRQNPDQHGWQVRTDQGNPRVQTDYAIVSRIHNPTTEQAVVVAAGIKGGGTYAAGEFLTNPSYLDAALKNAPREWKEKNVQFVLSTQIYSGTPGPPQVVAAHYW